MAVRAMRQFAVGGLYGWMSIPPRNTGKVVGRASGGSIAERGYGSGRSQGSHLLYTIVEGEPGLSGIEMFWIYGLSLPNSSPREIDKNSLRRARRRSLAGVSSRQLRKCSRASRRPWFNRYRNSAPD